MKKIRDRVFTKRGFCRPWRDRQNFTCRSDAFVAKGINRLGRVDDGNTVLDFDPEETRRHISINTALAPVEWKNHKINVLDTPGYFDFVGDVIAGLTVADSALLVVCASNGGVEVGTEKSWEYLEEANLPRTIFVNKMERENANFKKALGELREHFGPPKIVPIQLPIGDGETFKGIVDLVKMKAFSKDGDELKEADIPRRHGRGGSGGSPRGNDRSGRGGGR